VTQWSLSRHHWANADRRLAKCWSNVYRSHNNSRQTSKAESTFGKIDVLVNNAGYGYFSSIEEGEDQKIRAQLETNVFGLLW
jgi:short-subunit dehydrogenase